ncbi:MAG: MATE family efflux transporter [Deltaproteobacteria bacterium]|nr:MAG: MATE family efflux transporter [Deltaproteobacteria bacterium]
MSSPVRIEMRELLRIAFPLALSNVGNQLLGLVDTAVVGRLGEVPLGAVGLGGGLYFVVAVIGLGLMLGLDPLITQALGADDRRQARHLFVQGLSIAVAVTLPLLLLMYGAVALLPLFGIDAETARETGDYVNARLPSLLPFLLLIGGRSYLSANSITRPMVVAVIVANVINLPMSWALVFGDAGLTPYGLPALGVPALGVAGAGWTSTVCTVVQMAIVLYAARAVGREVEDEPGTSWSLRPDPAAIRRALALGTPIALTLLAEVGIFTLVGILAGVLGSRPLAAHNVALALAATTFQVALAINAAATVRVGRSVGEGDQAKARRAGFVALGVSATFMSLNGLLFVAFPEGYARLITDDPNVIAVAAPLMVVAAAFQLVDGLQVVSAGALRGAGDTRFALVANLAGHYAVGVPIALYLTWPAEMGVTGLWWGLCAGLSCVAVALVARFDRISRREIARA